MGIEPTNNHAEQQIRPSVIWEKFHLAQDLKQAVYLLQTYLHCLPHAKNKFIPPN